MIKIASSGIQRINPCLWQEPSGGIIPAMTTTVDQRRRAVLPFKPGDVLHVERQTPDTVVLRRMEPVKHPKPKVVRIKGELFSKGGGPLTSEEVRRMIEEEG
jgi:hypothetical protein